MTNEEAKLRLEQFAPFLVGDEWKECYLLAIEALEKQIAKKPIDDWSESPFSDDKGCLFLHTMCPNCKRLEVNKMDLFCPNCGQAIDWSDDE